MFERMNGDRRVVRVALSALVLALASGAFATPAEAHRHHRYHAGARVHFHARHHGGHAVRHAHHGVGGQVAGGATAAIAVDGASGHVLWAMNEHAPRHPASVTKVMTLYLLFEQLEKGRLTLDSEIPISAHAAAQAPSKLGLRPGSTIRVEDAIKVIVTKSANDIAVAVAEAVGGSESDFAEMMTHKAHALGMSHTLYRNASGLPNNEQITTAYDLAILGRDIQARFPRYYRYFSLHEVAYRGQRIHNHNHLMDRVEGMDGIKTGYTAASGFNLLSSVKRDGHYLITVVMGGRSAHARDAYMENLIEAQIDSAGGRGATQVAENDEAEAEKAAPVESARAEPVKAEPVKAEAVKAESRPAEPLRLNLAAVAPDPRPRPAYIAATARPAPVASETHEARLDREAKIDRDATVGATRRAANDGSTRGARDAAAPATPGGMRWIAGANARHVADAKTKTEARNEEGVSAHGKDVASAKPAVSGWTIQIGATDDADKANALLKKAREKRAALLASARPYTETVRKGHETLYRARFAGLEESRAEAVCKALKSSGFSCFATRN